MSNTNNAKEPKCTLQVRTLFNSTISDFDTSPFHNLLRIPYSHREPKLHMRTSVSLYQLLHHLCNFHLISFQNASLYLKHLRQTQRLQTHNRLAISTFSDQKTLAVVVVVARTWKSRVSNLWRSVSGGNFMVPRETPSPSSPSDGTTPRSSSGEALATTAGVVWSLRRDNGATSLRDEREDGGLLMGWRRGGRRR